MPIIITNEPSGKEARHIFLGKPQVKRPVYGPKMTKPHEVLCLMNKPKQSFLVYMRPKTSWLRTIMNSSINGNSQGYLLNISSVQISNWKHGITFGCTGRYILQWNHLAGLGFSILANEGGALIQNASILIEVRYKVWYEAF